MEGHQGTSKPLHQLISNANQNEKMDLLANHIIWSSSKTTETWPQQGIPFITHKDFPITGELELSLYYCTLQQPLGKYLDSCGIIGENSNSLIAWMTIWKAKKYRNQNLQVLKLACHQLPTFVIFKQQGHATHDFCLLRRKLQIIFSPVNTTLNSINGRHPLYPAKHGSTIPTPVHSLLNLFPPWYNNRSLILQHANPLPHLITI